MNRITLFGGTGFLGRRVARHLRASGATVRSASRHPGRADGDDGVERIAANVHDQRSIEAAVAGAGKLYVRPMRWHKRTMALRE